MPSEPSATAVSAARISQSRVIKMRRVGMRRPASRAGPYVMANGENIRGVANTKYVAYNSFRGSRTMSDVLVCAEPEARKEAAEFVSKLGAHPQVWSRSFLKKRSEKEKVRGVFVFVAKGAGDLGMLKSCLKQMPKQSSWHVVVFSHPSSNHQTAELGKIVGEFRPRRTHICFDSQEVEKIFHVDMRIASGRKKEDANEAPSLSSRGPKPYAGGRRFGARRDSTNCAELGEPRAGVTAKIPGLERAARAGPKIRSDRRGRQMDGHAERRFPKAHAA